jgi:hypothetical protein
MLYNFVIGAGAKGVLMIPEDMIPEGMTIEDFADRWIRFNGIITYKLKPSMPNVMPQQITAHSIPAGLFDMVSLQISLIEDISGVHGAVQGKTPTAGTSGTLYQQETQNATTNSLDLMRTHSAFKEMRDRKVLKTAIQFYNGKRKIISSKHNGGIITFDPEQIRNIDFDIKIIQNMDSPLYRSLTEDRLTQMVTAGILTPEIYFENSSDPTMKKINESMKKMKEQQIAGQGAAGDIPPEMLQAAQQGNPEALQMLRQAVGTPQTTTNDNIPQQA